MKGGIDLGGTKVQAVVVDDDHEVVGDARLPTPTEGGPAAIIAEMAVAMASAAEAAGVETGELAGVGVGCPGSIDAEAGIVRSAPNLSGWSEPFPLGAALGERIGCPVRLDNDVQVAVEGEFALGAGR